MTGLPLHQPEHDLPAGSLSREVALQLAREALDKHAGADIRHGHAMYLAASDLHFALRNLVAAILAS